MACGDYRQQSLGKPDYQPDHNRCPDQDSRISGADAGRGDEIGSLSRGFNQVADNLAKLLEAERTLIRDISHKLRSPLARMKMAPALLKQDIGL